MITKRDRILGACYGSIFGDIIGAYNEFQDGYMIRKITMDMLRREDDIFGHSFGYFTDDSTCALITMDAFDKDLPMMFDTNFIMKELKDWRDNGAYSSTMQCFDIGRSTEAAIAGNPITDPARGNGNGALMRIAPVCIAAHLQPYKSGAIQQIAQLTHPVALSNQMCIRYFIYMHSILRGDSKEKLAKEHEPIDIYRHSQIIQNKPTEPEDLVPYGRPSGFVVDTLYWAWKVFLETDSYLEGVIRLAEMGDDSDTVCCVYGALAGAYYGMKGVEETPQDLRDRLSKKPFVDDTINRFVNALLS